MENDCGCRLETLPDGSIDQMWCAEHSRMALPDDLGDQGKDSVEPMTLEPPQRLLLALLTKDERLTEGERRVISQALGVHGNYILDSPWNFECRISS
jgi:hypothetical protein